MGTGWNHNVQYHNAILRAIPPGCKRALDVGCGKGEFTQILARRCEEVVAIDFDLQCLTLARADPETGSNITFIHGDILSHPFKEDSFDVVIAIAVLHHLPLLEALSQFRLLLRPGGVLIVVGLYRKEKVMDFALSAFALPISWIIRHVRSEAEVGTPLRSPAETLQDIRAACDSLLPGGAFRRRLFFRYFFTWMKPSSSSLP